MAQDDLWDSWATEAGLDSDFKVIPDNDEMFSDLYDLVRSTRRLPGWIADAVSAAHLPLSGQWLTASV